MQLSLVFKALSDGNRRKILRMLEKGNMTAGEIAEQFDISKPSISHHLNVLKQANLVQDMRKGQNIYYELNTTVFQDVLNWFHEIRGRNGGVTDDE
ncbi:MAG TPA: winged helix-turn-helix transcriptional regulator [Firmicutes bacterium]|nr:winged helix-turn-helix transcriptional regulator [Bacillota bacterium]